MTNYSIGDIYSVKVEFDEGNGKSKYRPCVIVDIIDGSPRVYLMATLTGVGPKIPPNFFDLKKVELKDWQIAGLKKESWAKTDSQNIKRYEESVFGTFRGSLTPEDLSSILQKMYLS